MTRLFRLLYAIAVLASSAAAFAQEYAQGGYADRTSVVQGGSIGFHIATATAPFSLQIVNLARPAEVLATIGGLTAPPRDCAGMWESGCGWPETTRFTIPATWPSGFYAAKFPTGNGQRHVFFIVRAADPGSSSPIVLIATTHTYQAYNRWGGKSLYDSLSTNGARAHVLSYERPYSDNNGLGRFPLWEQQFVDFMRDEGRNFDVIADEDLQDPSILGNYDLALLVGHSEYWTLEARQHLEAFRNAGGHIAIFAGNTMWWQVRFDPATRRMTGYKSAALDPLTGTNDDVVTVNFYDRPVYNPENLITGASFRYGGYANIVAAGTTTPLPDGQRTPYTVVEPSHWVFDGTGVVDGQEIAQAAGGIEVDGVTFNTLPSGALEVDGADGTPLNFEILATLPADEGYGVIGLYTHPNGAVVFNAATRDWSHSLRADAIVQQITRNVLDRLSTGLPQPYVPRTSPWLTEDLFNTPSPDGPLTGVLPNWRGDLQAASLSARCAHEGPFGLELTGTQWTQVERTLTWDGSSLDELELELFLNANLLTQTATWAIPLIELSSRASGTLTVYAALELLKEGATRSVRVTTLRADGSTSASTSWVVLPSGWSQVRVTWRSPGTVELRVGAAAPVQTTNPEAGQGVDALVMNFPGTAFDARGSVCVDALRLQRGEAACDLPAITEHPQSETIVNGSSTTLAVTATGADSYQWFANNAPIGGATESSVLLSPASTTTYFVRVTNDCGSIDSDIATVTVCDLPAITAHPQSLTIVNGTSTTLSVTATGADSYQWYANNTPIGGATGSSVTVSPTSTTTYFVRVANDCGSVDSNPATVTVCNRPTITAHPTSRTITAGTSTTLTVSATGATSYQWYANNTPIGGATGTALTVAPAATTTYFVRVTNTCGTVQSNSATVTVQAPAARLRSDFDGDGDDDVYWHNPATRENLLWLMNGPARTAVALPSCDPGWRPLAIGDWNGDRRADLFFQHTSGQTAIWLLNGGTVIGRQLAPFASSALRLEGSGDFNGDGRSDLLWRNTSTGVTTIWFQASAAASSASMPLSYDVAGIADFNGDRRDDILFHNGTTLANALWLMNGATASAYTLPMSTDPAWQVAAAGDLNLDGRADIFWWNPATRQTAAWFMNGPTRTAASMSRTQLPGWHPRTTGDFNRDGRTDIFWRNSSGANEIWWMNGAAVTVAAMPAMASGWETLE